MSYMVVKVTSAISIKGSRTVSSLPGSADMPSSWNEVLLRAAVRSNSASVTSIGRTSGKPNTILKLIEYRKSYIS